MPAPSSVTNFSTQDNTHGNSLAHRAPGSIGQNQTPGRVFKGKKMSGHLGNVKRTQQGLEVVQVDAERNLIAVKGSVPGPCRRPPDRQADGQGPSNKSRALR